MQKLTSLIEFSLILIKLTDKVSKPNDHRLLSKPLTIQHVQRWTDLIVLYELGIWVLGKKLLLKEDLGALCIVVHYLTRLSLHTDNEFTDSKGCVSLYTLQCRVLRACICLSKRRPSGKG